MVRVVGRDHDRLVHDHRGVHHQVRLLVVLVVVERDPRVVGHFLAERGVVRLEADGAAARDPGAHVLGRDLALGAHGIAAQRSAPLVLERLGAGRHVLQVAGQHMVNALAALHLGRGRPQPLAFGGGVLRPGVLVVDHAGGRDGVGGDVEDGVRLAQRPFGGHVRLGAQRVLALAARRALLHPMHQGLDLGLRQMLVVRELSHVRVGVVGRHPAGADHLTDHRGEALDHLVAGEGHRADPALFVAFHAVLLEDRGHVLDVGDRDLLVARREVDQAALGHLGGRRDHLAAQEGGNGVFGEGLAGVLLDAVVGAVVDRAAIDHLPGLRVDHEDFRRAGEAERLADDLIAVHQDRDVDAEFLGLVDNGLAAVLQVGVDQHHLNALSRELVAQGLERRGHGARDRAADAGRDQHDRLGVAHPVELVGLQVLGVHQHEVVDPLEPGDRSGGGRRSVGGIVGRRRGRKSGNQEGAHRRSEHAKSRRHHRFIP